MYEDEIVYEDKIEISIVEDVVLLPRSRSEADIYLHYSLYPISLNVVRGSDDESLVAELAEIVELGVSDDMKEQIVIYLAAHDLYAVYKDKTVIFSKYGLIEALAYTLCRDERARGKIIKLLKGEENRKLFSDLVNFLTDARYFVQSESGAIFITRTLSNGTDTYKAYSIRLSYNIFQDFLDETVVGVLLKYPAHSVVNSSAYADRYLF